MILNGVNDETRIKVSGRQREWSFRNCTHTYRNMSPKDTYVYAIKEDEYENRKMSGTVDGIL